MTGAPHAVEPPAAALAAELARELSARLGERVEVGEPAPFGDGHSGFTYALDVARGGVAERCVLRLSPPGARIAGPADVGRQGRIMAALGAQGLPAPRVLACASEPCVGGRAFALMELVEGESWAAALAAGAARRELAARAVALLGRLRALAPELTGIGGEPPTAPAAELARWSALLARTPLRDAARGLVRTLERALPPAPAVPSLVHGDFHYGNLLFRDGEIVAVLDWEIATLGDPLADLGCLAVSSLRERYAPDPNPTGFALPLGELLALDGADPDRAGWAVAASCLKYAAILAFNRELHRRGRRVDPVYEQLDRTIHGLLDDGAALLGGRRGAGSSA